MRRGIILMLLFTLAFTARAQVHMGIRAGMNMSTITGGLQNGFEKRIAFGPGGGLVVTVPVTEKIYIQTELLLNARGTAYKVFTAGTVEEGHISLYYLDVPILIKGYLGGGALRGYLGTGPQLSSGLFLHNYYEVVSVGVSERDSEVEAFPDLYRRFEIAWNIDIGMHLELDNRSAIEIGVRPVIGLTQLVKNQFTDQNTRNIMITLTAAYLFSREGRSKPPHFIP